MKRMACVLALVASAGLTTAVLAPAMAEKAITPAGNGLQLTLTAAGSVPADSALTLDVRFEGGSLRMVELQVDGTTVKKKSVTTKSVRGHLEFQIEAGLLGEGSHDIVIKAEDATGNIATTTTQIKVTSGANGLVKFMALKNKGLVQGVVPIEVKLDSSLHNPYVSFFVDDTFLALTNYAPFTVNWDSSHATNGLHTVSVEVYDGETLAKIKTTSIQLNVNNPGGLTNRQNETPDLAKGKLGGAPATATAILETVDASRYVANPHSTLEASAATNGTMRFSGIAPVAGSGLRSITPGSMANFNGDNAPVKPTTPFSPANKVTSLGPINPATPAIPAANVAPVTPIANADRNNTTVPARVKVTKPGVLGTFADPHALASLANNREAGSRLVHNIRPRRAGNMAARPALTMDAHNYDVAETPIAPIRIVRGERTLPGFTTSHGLQVAFDNTRIAFDVQPRIERGMPIAPFRQIFEHTGGKITWYNQSKTLRAVNSTHEIELHVGDDEAKVNNQTVKIETRTFIEKGRTLVPLSFVRDALDVNVTYDASSGRLRIESKK